MQAPKAPEADTGSFGPRLGAHMSIAGGPARALQRGHSIGCQTIQMFTRNANRWDAPALTEESVAGFAQARATTGIHPIVAHSSYLINLASPDVVLWQRSLDAFCQELARCQLLGVGDYVLHPGAHMGSGEEAGMARVVEALDRTCATDIAPDVVILLETTAGQGSVLGRTFEHLAWMTQHASHPERLGICFDTAHVLASGYEFRTPDAYAALWASFHALLGRERLRAIHLNDSRGDLGSHLDRHAHIGQGHVSLEAFRMLLNDPALRHVPMLLETPKGEDMAEDVANLALLRSLIGYCA